MTALAEEYVRVRADTSSLKPEITRGLDSATPAAATAGKRSGSSFIGAFKLPLLAGAAIAGAGLIRVLSGFIDAAQESRRVSNLTAAVIKSTGGAAKVTADQVGDLANAISIKTGVDDETVQTGANLLLTFKQVRNEVGKGNDIFNQATAAAVDLSAAGFGSVDSASKMLGKALNDPIAGISALGRAGVTFTAQQKLQIAEMVKSGDALGAQKIILGEVQSQVGGAAAATGTASDKMGTAVDNIKERIGKGLLPVVDKFAGFITNTVLPAATKFFDAIENGGKGGGALNAFVRILLGNLALLKTAWDNNKASILPLLKILGPILGAVIVGIIGQITVTITVLGALMKAAGFVKSVMISAFTVIASTFLTVVGALINGAAKAFGWVPGVGPKLKAAAAGFNSFRDTANAALRAINGEIPISVTGVSAAERAFAQVADAALRAHLVGVNYSVTAGSASQRRAAGGPVRAGVPYIVGEHRPELFVPRTDGTIIPRVPTASTTSTSDDSGGGGMVAALVAAWQGMAWQVRLDPQGLATIVAVGNRANGRRG